jgi:hypothetical protein
MHNFRDSHGPVALRVRRPASDTPRIPPRAGNLVSVAGLLLALGAALVLALVVIAVLIRVIHAP